VASVEICQQALTHTAAGVIFVNEAFIARACTASSIKQSIRGWQVFAGRNSGPIGARVWSTSICICNQGTQVVVAVRYAVTGANIPQSEMGGSTRRKHNRLPMVAYPYTLRCHLHKRIHGTGMSTSAHGHRHLQGQGGRRKLQYRLRHCKELHHRH
jgi:hypothetical protein